MNTILNYTHKIEQKVNFAQNILQNPFEFLLDLIVRAVVYMFIPIPVVAEIIIQFKGIIVTVLFNAVLVIAVIIVLLLNAFTNQNLTKQANATEISIPADGSFASTETPLQNPLGGQGLSLVKITAGFMDPNYTFFGGIHTGVDLVPNDLYFQTNKTYKDTGDIVAFATMNGRVNYYIDQYGSHTIEIVNTENTIKTIYMHLNKILVSSGQMITAGTPIGTMGDTGFSTSEHLHYEIRINNGGTWTPVNPLDYIH
jgi:murein DD-endopeptidase MepM/ murein hydrolase activator NlpD